MMTSLLPLLPYDRLCWLAYTLLKLFPNKSIKLQVSAIFSAIATESSLMLHRGS